MGYVQFIPAPPTMKWQRCRGCQFGRIYLGREFVDDGAVADEVDSETT